ncbi:MAG: LemA family protein [Bacteroidaceae bacterium]|nr:LemA family protein [Bacteroidaceae bacterium]MBQ1199790.1 LemA family protein [Bacteroidaceae bacterium]MBR3982490.1 LemA family protein [Bacteroidaceae bacterium]
MKKSTIIIIVVAVIAVIWGISGYNGLVSMDEGVQTKWADVETQYQRRADLIPNLVNTVKGYAAHESETLQAVVEARAKATSMNIDPSNMSAEQIANFQKAQDGVSSALSRLLVTVEKYPDLKANENFKELQVQLEGTENRISVARRDYNESARKYNTTLRSFPKNILAGMFGFEKKAYFEAQEGSEQAPTVQF